MSGLRFDNLIVGVCSPNGNERVNQASFAEKRAGIQDRIASDLCTVADNCAEFLLPGWVSVSIKISDSDLSLYNLLVREFCACP